MLSFAAPPTRRSGAIEPEYLGQIVDAFGIGHDQVLAHQWVDTGRLAVVRLATAQEVLGLQPDLSRIPAAMVGAIGAYPAGSDYAFELRTFAPGVGVAEDPVCGSMNAAVAQWLVRTCPCRRYRVAQGRRLGRAGGRHDHRRPGRDRLGRREHEHPVPRHGRGLILAANGPPNPAA